MEAPHTESSDRGAVMADPFESLDAVDAAVCSDVKRKNAGACQVPLLRHIGVFRAFGIPS